MTANDPHGRPGEPDPSTSAQQGPADDAEVHVGTTDARSGSIEHVVRYVLIIGLVLVILAFLLVGGFMRI